MAIFGHRDRNGTHSACVSGAPKHNLQWSELVWRPWSGPEPAMSVAEAEAWGCPLHVLRLGTLSRPLDTSGV